MQQLFRYSCARQSLKFVRKRTDRPIARERGQAYGCCCLQCSWANRGPAEGAGAMADQRLSNEPRNMLLARMACSDLGLLQPHLEPVALRFRQRLESANRKIRNAYFIERGIASVVAVGSADRRQAEVTIVGREGM